MKILVVGATGATGKWLVKQLLDEGHEVSVIVRSAKKLQEFIGHHERLTQIEASLLDLSDTQMQEYTKGCGAIASCLGHNLTFKGIYGAPHRLVTDAVKRLVAAAKANQPSGQLKYVLMNTTGVRNRDIDEQTSFGQRMVIGLLTVLLPPHADNENAAKYLRTQLGQNDPVFEWVAVRPDGLVDNEIVTKYSLHPSPTRSAIFDAGQTSRINVAHFMATLITNDELWKQWQGQMPVIYNKD